ncbi:hypothetical protein HCB21_12330 [Listeria booriae]|uniref:Uncharacterized protein n=1 Tax=Listeria booriae TaxID=1552123 RepID=A0A842CXP8_9LIST|nr:hypothetical protein [Listeria booriae]MBC1795545.1 hypothetical protein [Listeria booriae]MBC1811341.1 hypothetical protein [Listeria booriae]MBC2020238.1 hypothetical protein [Listeria booriae]MBC2077782.1 hypothetical protein [Listeria booriae]MBC2147165.1 hypothetical protein [Listeria booriae]
MNKPFLWEMLIFIVTVGVAIIVFNLIDDLPLLARFGISVVMFLCIFEISKYVRKRLNH